MKVKDYDYEYDEFEEVELSDERKQELLTKVNEYLRRGNVPLYRILQVCKNDVEDNFVYRWLEQNHVQISGIEGSLSGEFNNYKYIPKMGQSYIPDTLEEAEQERLFYELDKLKKKGLNSNNSKQYKEIRDTLIEHNMRLARWVARSKSLNNLGLERKDLEQSAMESLIKAVENFDISYGYKFSTYAVPTIYYGAKKSKLEDEKYKNNQDILCKRLEQYEWEFLRDNNRRPTDEEIKIFLGINDKRLETLRKYINYQFQESLERINEGDEDFIIEELLDDERIAELEGKQIINGIYREETEMAELEDSRSVEETGIQDTLRQDIEKMLGELTDRERRVLELRFGFDGKSRTLEETRKIF